MNFTTSLISKLSEKSLLNHEFYQMWNCGSIPMETLRLYARQYYGHVAAFPRYLSATHSQSDNLKARQFLLQNLRDEEEGEENHPELWMRFAEGLGETREAVKAEQSQLLPETQGLMDCFMESSKSSFAAGLGALFAYEHQIPAIASFKIDALKNHYGIQSRDALAFFDVHQKADVYHTVALSDLLEGLSFQEKQVAEQSARVAGGQLWSFLDGIHGTMLA